MSFDEHLHPRAGDGKFSHTPGGGKVEVRSRRRGAAEVVERRAPVAGSPAPSAAGGASWTSHSATHHVGHVDGSQYHLKRSGGAWSVYHGHPDEKRKVGAAGSLADARTAAEGHAREARKATPATPAVAAKPAVAARRPYEPGGPHGSRGNITNPLPRNATKVLPPAKVLDHARRPEDLKDGDTFVYGGQAWQIKGKPRFSEHYNDWVVFGRNKRGSGSNFHLRDPHYKVVDGFGPLPG